MSFFHVRITQVSDAYSDEIRLDMSFDEYEQAIGKPRNLNQEITINGKTIPQDDIKRIRVSTTDHESSYYHADAELCLTRDWAGVIPGPSLEWVIADLGKDVTNELVVGPPGSELESQQESVRDRRPPASAREVFVVHGRNVAARDAVFEFLRSIDLHPLEWSETIQSTGKPTPYIGEILDAAFSRVHAVLILLTPDDEARLRKAFRMTGDPPHEIELSGQARPNVLFEAGMAMGRDENRTVLVELGIIRPFSDVAGRHVIRLDDSTQRRQELAHRLQAAGCPVNLDGTDWHTAGDFEAALEQTRSPEA